MHARSLLEGSRRAVQATAGWLADALGLDELLFGAGLLLIGVGMWRVWQPGAFIIPGAILVWISLPQRKPFLEQRQPESYSARPPARRDI